MKLNLSNLIFILITLISHSFASAFDKSQVISFGVVPQYSHMTLEKKWLPFIAELEKETGHRFKLLHSTSIPEFEDEVGIGRFDLAYMSPYHLIVGNAKQGYLPLVRDKAKKLKGIVVVRNDSNITNIKQLKNSLIAFPSKKALAASMFVRADLSKLKIPFKARYVKSHSSVYLNVLLKKTMAGGGAQRTFDSQPKEIKNELKVIHSTKSIFAHPIVAHPRINKKVIEKIKQTILKMNNYPAGKKILQNISSGSIGNAHINDYKDIKKLYD